MHSKQFLNRGTVLGQFYKKALLKGEVLKIVIPLNPITKKNSGQIITNKKTGKKMLIPSKQFLKYEKNCKMFLLKYLNINIDLKINVKCLFYMEKRYRVDLVNLLESIDDILSNKEYKIIKDDNSTVIAGHDGSRVLYDKNNPRTEIYISLLDE